MSFEILVLAAFAGLCARALIGFDLVKAAGVVAFSILVIPGLFPIAVQHDPVVVQSMGAEYIQRVTDALPSIIIGQIAGLFAKEIFSLFKGILGELAG